MPDLIRKVIPRDCQYRRNAYVCEACRRVMVTIDRDAGTTPFLVRCRWCGKGTAQSSFYRVRDHTTPPEFEWYRPDAGELREIARADRATLEHVLKGGLLLRAIPTHYALLPAGESPFLPEDVELPLIWPITEGD